MKTTFRICALVLLGAITACTSTTDRQYDGGCLVGLSALGAVVTGASGGIAAAGVAGGAGVAAVVCGEEGGQVQPERAVVEPPVEDSDGDGVVDGNDRCPNTRAGVAVDSVGCALDSDGDGVPDFRDDCRNTPTGVTVDSRGCPVKDEVVLTVDRLGFAFDSFALDAPSQAALDAAVDVIKSHSSVQLDVVGYTDSRGTDEYNQTLSERRAQAAVDYLVSKGVSRDQLRPIGRGESSPVASNDTDDGRARNRRVELVVR
ncbi:MAG: OmpA family protein [Pseudomonadota bacterium]